MAKKKKEEEHENLERWLVSYADFMTLIFATFVVLYALSQIDAAEYEKLQESIKDAFNNSALEDLLKMSGADLLNADGQSVMTQGASPNDAVVPPIMEYVSAKYEKESMENIKSEIEDAAAKGELDGIEAEITDRGLVIRLKDLNFFDSGSATIKRAAYPKLEKIGGLITKRFSNHLIRIEGHTDNIPLSTSRFPSNWELSASRAASVGRFLMSSYKIKPILFTIIGYAETKPLAPNTNAENMAKNRRVEIVILKNSVAKYEPDGEQIITGKDKEFREKFEVKQKKNAVSEAAKNLLDNDSEEDWQNVIILDEFPNSKNDNIKKQIYDFESGKEAQRNKIKVR